MLHQIAIDPSAAAGIERGGHGLRLVAEDVAAVSLGIVNVAIIANRAERSFVLIDAGLAGSAGRIEAAARSFAGDDARPVAIVLTHGHFDHVGALRSLAERWDVPIYAHERELPFLDGREAYPPPDAEAGGLMSRLSPLFPRGPINVEPWLRRLPTGEAMPMLPDWSVIETPGHSPGHVSLWRVSDRFILAGDAFITTRQESAYAALAHPLELHGPPMYFTADWGAARESVQRLAALKPEVAITGHGEPVSGPTLTEGLDRLAEAFDQVALPASAPRADQTDRA
jgi:glyoxylase-like metal-dependent hydrolase (beta-lactamase superfamily II)